MYEDPEISVESENEEPKVEEPGAEEPGAEEPIDEQKVEKPVGLLVKKIKKKVRRKKPRFRVTRGNYSFHGKDGKYHELKAGDVFDASIIEATAIDQGLKRGRFEKVK